MMSEFSGRPVMASRIQPTIFGRINREDCPPPPTATDKGEVMPSTKNNHRSTWFGLIIVGLAVVSLIGLSSSRVGAEVVDRDQSASPTLAFGLIPAPWSQEVIVVHITDGRSGSDDAFDPFSLMGPDFLVDYVTGQAPVSFVTDVIIEAGNDWGHTSWGPTGEGGGGSLNGRDPTAWALGRALAECDAAVLAPKSAVTSCRVVLVNYQAPDLSPEDALELKVAFELVAAGYQLDTIAVVADVGPAVCQTQSGQIEMNQACSLNPDRHHHQLFNCYLSAIYGFWQISFQDMAACLLYRPVASPAQVYLDLDWLLGW